ALLAAIGLTTLLWLAVSLVGRLGRGPALPAYLLLPAEGDAPALEATVHDLQRLRRELRGFPPILILDCGLTEEAREIALLLCAEDRGVALCVGKGFLWDE
ncbi:MAG: hypothetical protein RR092_06790, partial [Oscillospiraceae bacterium]